MTSWTIEQPALPASAPGTGTVFAVGAGVTDALAPGTPAALLTSGGVLAVATPKDINLVAWQPVAAAPVLPAPPASSNYTMVGDVSVSYRGNNTWWAVVGSSTGDGMKTGAPAALLYTSKDLKTWCVIPNQRALLSCAMGCVCARY
jgi:hypothetical protein